MASSIPFQFARSKDLLEIGSLVVRKSLACVTPMWFLPRFEIKPDILRGPTMQCQTYPGKLLTALQILSTEKTRIVLLLHHICSYLVP